MKVDGRTVRNPGLDTQNGRANLVNEECGRHAIASDGSTWSRGCDNERGSIRDLKNNGVEVWGLERNSQLPYSQLGL